MTTRRRAILLGFVVWAVLFAAGSVSLPVRELWRALFESIMALVLAAIVVVASAVHFNRVKEGYLKEGFSIGFLWLAICLLLDIPVYLYGPAGMPWNDYLADIGLTYIMIPTITIGFGVVLEKFHLQRR